MSALDFYPDLKELSTEDLERQLLIEKITERRAEAARATIEASHAAQLYAMEQAGNDTNRILTFFAAIDEQSAYDAIRATAIWARRDPKQPITVRINSPGGLVTETLAIYDHLRMLSQDGSPITTVGIGHIASGASALFQAGDTRLLTPNAFMLIHEASGGLRGKSSAMSDDLAHIQRLQAKMLNIYAERSTLTVDEINQRWNGREWWLDADEAVELGFADGIA